MPRVAWNWAVLLIIVTLAVVSGSCRDLDRAALDLTQRASSPGIDLLASLIGLLGAAEVTAAIAAGLAAARFRRYPRAAVIPLLIAVTVLLESALKLIVPQAPPPHERTRTVQLLPLLSVPFAYSFPSGHVARVAFLLRIANGVPAWAVAAGIVLMAISRVCLGEHWLSDAIGGAVLGLGTANVARRLA
jgi:membrane-associated phospholipid phosphatase